MLSSLFDVRFKFYIKISVFTGKLPMLYDNNYTARILLTHKHSNIRQFFIFVVVAVVAFNFERRYNIVFCIYDYLIATPVAIAVILV